MHVGFMCRNHSIFYYGFLRNGISVLTFSLVCASIIGGDYSNSTIFNFGTNRGAFRTVWQTTQLFWNFDTYSTHVFQQYNGIHQLSCSSCSLLNITLQFCKATRFRQTIFFLGVPHSRSYTRTKCNSWKC